MTNRDRDGRQGGGVARLDHTSITATEFLEEIFGTPEAGETPCVGRLNPTGSFRQMPPTAETFRKWSRRGRGGAWYFCVSTVAAVEDGAFLRRRKDDARAAHCAVLDDVGTKVDPTAAELPPPSWALETSPGNFQWGYVLDPATEDREPYEGFLRVLAERGLTDRGSVDFVHMFRLPGSQNLKLGDSSFRARLTEWAPDRAFSLPELMDLCGVGAAEARAAGPRARPRRAGPIAMPEDLEVPDPVLAWLVARGLALSDPEGDWVDVRCPWYEEHTGADVGGTSYSPLGRGADDWPLWRSFKCLHAHCAERRTGAFLRWVEEQGGPAANAYDPLAWLRRQYAVVVQDLLVADLDQRPLGGRWLMKKDEFGLLVPGSYRTPDRDRAIRLAAAFMEDRRTRKLARQVYRPDEAAGVVQVAGQDCLNVYARPAHPAADGAPAAFLAHMDFLIPDAGERSYFLDWLAFKLQYPGRRPPSIVMVADEAYGTGRGWLATLLEQVFRDVKYTHLKMLAGEDGAARFNEWEWRSQIVIVEEAKDVLSAGEQYHAYENMKRRVDTSPRSVEIDVKMGSKLEGQRYYAVLIFSNHTDALILPARDRRFCVITNAAEARGQAYYRALYGSLASGVGEAARAFRWLSARDVSEFDGVEAPMTEGKRLMIEQTASPVDEIAELTVKEARGDVISRLDLLWQLERMRDTLGYSESVDAKQLQFAAKRLWRKMGPLDPENRKHGFRTRVKGAQIEYRALRREMHWREAARRGDAETVVSEAAKNGRDFRPGARNFSVVDPDAGEEG